MKAVTKIVFLDDNGQKFFGEGPTQLLHEIEETGSVRGASIKMGMAYTKAVKLIKNAETALGFPIITRTTGGKNGGGSCLTKEGKEWLALYERYREACRVDNARLYKEFFPDQP